MDKARTLIYLHVNKAAGITAKMILRHQFQRKCIFQINGKTPVTVEKSLNKLKCLPYLDKLQIKCLMGHMAFGLHKYLPQPCVYVAFLRDPVDRVMSEYYHFLQTPDAYLYEKLNSENISLERYVNEGMFLSWNCQVRLVGDISDKRWTEIFGPMVLSNDDLEIAKLNLRRHFIIGITERFDESLILFKRAFGWESQSLLYSKQNVTIRRPHREGISGSTIRLIEKHNELDMQLYEFAERMFEEAISQQDGSFAEEVQAFQARNKDGLYHKAYSIFRNSRLFERTPRLRAVANRAIGRITNR